MARTTGPLMSLDASGSVAGTLTFSKWKGRNYVRQLVIPANPQTASQTAFRSLFGFLGSIWASIAGVDQDTWNGLADANKISDFNAYMSENQKTWKNYLAPMQSRLGDRSGVPPTILSQSATGGLGLATVVGALNAPNDAWGVAVFRSTVIGFAAGPGNLVHMQEVITGNGFTWVDSPLAAGTYYYRLRYFTIDGAWGTLGAEDPATVT